MNQPWRCEPHLVADLGAFTRLGCGGYRSPAAAHPTAEAPRSPHPQTADTSEEGELKQLLYSSQGTIRPHLSHIRVQVSLVIFLLHRHPGNSGFPRASCPNLTLGERCPHGWRSPPVCQGPCHRSEERGGHWRDSLKTHETCRLEQDAETVAPNPGIHAGCKRVPGKTGDSRLNRHWASQKPVQALAPQECSHSLLSWAVVFTSHFSSPSQCCVICCLRRA